jgi:thioredoxin-dependent peroxiredoxin
MNNAMLRAAAAFALLGMLGFAQAQQSKDVQAMKVAKESAQAGAGNTVNLKGNAVPLAGTPVKVGQPLPSAVVTGGDLGPVNLGENPGKVRIISVVPSVDTPTCEAQTHALSEKDRKLAEQVEMITVSMDLPFAQQRFAKDAKISNVKFYSDYKAGNFGNNNGLLIEPLHLLARAVIVVDKQNVVRYMQVVPELTELPDMPAAMNVAKSLL